MRMWEGRLQQVADELGVTVAELTTLPTGPLPTPPWRIKAPPKPAKSKHRRHETDGIKLPGLRAVRHSLDLGVVPFAQLVGVSTSSISLWERGSNARPAVAARIAASLGVPLSILTTAPAVPTPERLPWTHRLRSAPQTAPRPKPTRGKSKGALVPGLRAIRFERGMTGAELARLLGVHPGTVSHWEHLQTGLDPDRLADVASELEVAVSDLTSDPRIKQPDYANNCAIPETAPIRSQQRSE